MNTESFARSFKVYDICTICKELLIKSKGLKSTELKFTEPKVQDNISQNILSDYCCVTCVKCRDWDWIKHKCNNCKNDLLSYCESHYSTTNNLSKSYMSMYLDLKDKPEFINCSYLVSVEDIENIFKSDKQKQVQERQDFSRQVQTKFLPIKQNRSCFLFLKKFTCSKPKT
jgi:hypothetical protein